MSAEDQPRMRVVELQTEERIPSELLQVLEHAVECAKNGTLRECIFDFTYDAGGQSEICPEDGSPMLHGGHFFWRSDGRLDAIACQSAILAQHALDRVMGRGD